MHIYWKGVSQALQWHQAQEPSDAACLVVTWCCHDFQNRTNKNKILPIYSHVGSRKRRMGVLHVDICALAMPAERNDQSPSLGCLLVEVVAWRGVVHRRKTHEWSRKKDIMQGEKVYAIPRLKVDLRLRFHSSLALSFPLVFDLPAKNSYLFYLIFSTKFYFLFHFIYLFLPKKTNQ